MASWLKGILGLDPRTLYPSVLTAVEAALLSALAASRGETLAHLLRRSPPVEAASQEYVPVNALMDCPGGVQECRAQAAELARLGFSCIKIKVEACVVWCRALCWGIGWGMLSFYFPPPSHLAVLLGEDWTGEAYRRVSGCESRAGWHLHSPWVWSPDSAGFCGLTLTM